MKYIETYENMSEPEIGDWVICKDVNTFNEDNDIIDFIDNNVGQIIKITKIVYLIKYGINFNKVEFEPESFGFPSDDGLGVRRFQRSEIKHWSKDKENLEAILAANKYNL